MNRLDVASRIRRVGLAALSVLLLCSTADASDNTPICTNLPPSDLKVLAFNRDARTVSVGLAELRRLSDEVRTFAPLPRPHPLTVIVAKLSVQVTMDPRTVEVAEDAVCATPVSVSVGVGFAERIIYIADAAAAQPCVWQELLTHDEMHARADDVAVVTFLARIEEPLLQALAALKRRPAPNARVAVERFEAGITAFLVAAEAAFDEERTRLHASIDSPEAMERLGDACDGGVRRLQDKAGDGAQRL